MKPTSKKLVLVLPSLTAGGMERVMVLLANYFHKHPTIEPILILLANVEEFHVLPEEFQVVRPPFDHKNYNRFFFTIKTLKYLRNELKRFQPDVLLSFGGRYNSFVILAALGLGIKSFLSDRSRPDISYGKLLDFLNPILYKKAVGIIAQTQKSKLFLLQQTGNKNIQVIGNPIPPFNKKDVEKENIIINTGRFIPSKQQDLLIEFFSKIDAPDWKLVFLGDGVFLEECKQKAMQSPASDRIIFEGHQIEIENYYARSKIFAFTSSSEGFPNALAEAMSAGLACISFNCNAGPSDMIQDGENGFLVEEHNHQKFIEKLTTLMKNKSIRDTFGVKAVSSMKKFHVDSIFQQFENFMFQ